MLGTIPIMGGTTPTVLGVGVLSYRWQQYQGQIIVHAHARVGTGFHCTVLAPCVVLLVPCVVALVPCVVALVPCVVPLLPCVPTWARGLIAPS